MHLDLDKLDLPPVNYVPEGLTPASIEGTPRNPALSELDNALKHSALPRESITPRTEPNESTTALAHPTSSVHDNKSQTTSSYNSNTSTTLKAIPVSSNKNRSSSPLVSLSLAGPPPSRVQPNPKSDKPGFCCFW